MRRAAPGLASTQSRAFASLRENLALVSERASHFDCLFHLRV